MRFVRGLALGRPLGIPLFIHASWVPAALLFAGNFWAVFPGVAPPARLGLACVLTVVVFACLVAHEMAHALTARAHGLPVQGIALFVFGGVVRIGREPLRPVHELMIALAGPATSALIGGAALAASGPSLGGRGLRLLGLANLAIAGFNLLPGFPLDGGRILRAVLWSRGKEPYAAQRTSARCGQLLGLALVVPVVLKVLPAVQRVWLAALGFFLLVIATSARRAAVVAHRLSAERAGAWARPFERTLATGDEIPASGGPWGVSQRGRLVGVVRAGSYAPGTTALEQMVPWSDGLAVDALEPLTRAIERLDAEILVVVEAGRVVGVLERRAVRTRLTELVG